jgi:hypothetical protein
MGFREILDSETTGRHHLPYLQNGVGLCPVKGHHRFTLLFKGYATQGS